MKRKCVAEVYREFTAALDHCHQAFCKYVAARRLLDKQQAQQERKPARKPKPAPHSDEVHR